MDLVAIARIQLCLYIVAGGDQPVGDSVEAFSVGAVRILVAADAVNRELFRDLLRPLLACHILHHLNEVQESLIAGRLRESVERVISMVDLNVRVMADPLISKFHLTASLEHPAHKSDTDSRL